MTPKEGPNLGTIFWVIGALLVASVAIGLQMDREARNSGRVAQAVPSLLRSYAWETLARTAYAARENEIGLAYSVQLVLRRPVPAESLSLLTRGLLAAGKSNEALPALLLSAQRGWRDRFTQRLMVASALQVDDGGVASQRLLALWRLGERDTETKALTQRFFTTKDGLGQFGRGIIRSDVWSASLLIWGVDHLPGPETEAVAATMAKMHVDVDCAELSRPVGRLAQIGREQQAMSIWSKLCSDGELTHASDFRFRELTEGAGPFDWIFSEQAGLNTELIKEDNEVSLSYDYTGQIRVPLAKRNAALMPGRHTVRIEAESSGGMDIRPITLQITCHSEWRSANRIASLRLSGQDKYFQIPPSGCEGQEIALVIARGSERIHRLIID